MSVRHQHAQGQYLLQLNTRQCFRTSAPISEECPYIYRSPTHKANNCFRTSTVMQLHVTGSTYSNIFSIALADVLLLQTGTSKDRLRGYRGTEQKYKFGHLYAECRWSRPPAITLISPIWSACNFSWSFCKALSYSRVLQKQWRRLMIDFLKKQNEETIRDNRSRTLRYTNVATGLFYPVRTPSPKIKWVLLHFLHNRTFLFLIPNTWTEKLFLTHIPNYFYFQRSMRGTLSPRAQCIWHDP